MMYLVILSVWTLQFFLMVLYMRLELKQAKILQDWNNKTAIIVNANTERLHDLEDRVKELEGGEDVSC